MPELIGDLEFLAANLLRGAPGEKAVRRAIDEVKRLRAALADARSYVECVMLNATGDKKRRNYAGCLARIDEALNEQEVGDTK